MYFPYVLQHQIVQIFCLNPVTGEKLTAHLIAGLADL